MSKSFTDIVTILRNHFEPKPSIIAERYHFHKRNQGAEESIAEYVAELRRLAAKCSFPRDYLDETLRDRFVCGLRSESIQKSLLQGSDLSITKAVTRAQGMETAHRNAQDLKAALPIRKLSGQRKPWQASTRKPGRETYGRKPGRETYGRKPCHRCGKTGHTGQECSYRDVECHRCGKRGHIAKACVTG